MKVINLKQSIYGNTHWQATKKCFTCKWRLRRITGGCNIFTLTSHNGNINDTSDDMYGCDMYEELKKEKEK